MTQTQELVRDTTNRVAIAQTPDDLRLISQEDCPGVLWNRKPLVAFQSWIDALDPEQLPATRLILRPQAVRDAVSTACDIANTPKCTERTRFIDDISALADAFASAMDAPFLRLRLARVTTNACRKFHRDALTARLICTYRGEGTQYGISTDGADPRHILTCPKGAPIVLRGSDWPESPPSGLLHRSPPIEGSGATRLVLVLDPIFDPNQDM